MFVIFTRLKKNRERRKKQDELMEGFYENSLKSEYIRSSRIDHHAIYEKMKKDVGLSEVDINFLVGGYQAGATVCRELLEKPGTYEKYPYIQMSNDSIECYYKGTLRHELEHINTGLSLMDKIGINAYGNLQKNKDTNEYAACNTLSEFLSWKAACEMVPEESSTLMFWSEWKKPDYDYLIFLDVLSAHTAYNLIHEIEERYDERFSVQSIQCMKNISYILIQEYVNWPHTIEQYRIIGDSIMEQLSGIKEPHVIK